MSHTIVAYQGDEHSASVCVRTSIDVREIMGGPRTSWRYRVVRCRSITRICSSRCLDTVTNGAMIAADIGVGTIVGIDIFRCSFFFDSNAEFNVTG